MPAAPDLAAARAAGIRVLDEPAGKAILRGVGIATPEGRVVNSPAAAVEAAAAIGYPCMVKVVATDEPHKSEHGGVAGPFDHPEDLLAAAIRMASLTAVSDAQLLVEPWIAGDAELIMGLTFNSAFGPTLTFGVGGIWVEEYRDVAHRLAPVSHEEATAMILSRRAVRTFTGGRGGKSISIAELAEVIRCFSQLSTDPQIQAHVAEIEVNPLIVGAGAPPTAVDCTVVLRNSDDIFDHSTNESRA